MKTSLVGHRLANTEGRLYETNQCEASAFGGRRSYVRVLCRLIGNQAAVFHRCPSNNTASGCRSAPAGYRVDRRSDLMSGLATTDIGQRHSVKASARCLHPELSLPNRAALFSGPAVGLPWRVFLACKGAERRAVLPARSATAVRTNPDLNGTVERRGGISEQRGSARCCLLSTRAGA